MGDMNEYRSAVEWITAMAEILTKDYIARVEGKATVHTAEDMKKWVPNLAKEGTKLRKFFMDDIKAHKSAKPAKKAPTPSKAPILAPPPKPKITEDQGYAESLKQRFGEAVDLKIPVALNIPPDAPPSTPYLFYLAGKGLTTALAPNYTKYFIEWKDSFDKMGDITALDAFLTSIDVPKLITAAKHIPAIKTALDEDEDSFNDVDDTSSTAAFLAGYGITEEFMGDEKAHSTIQTIIDMYNNWYTTHQDYDDNVKSIAAFIAGFSTVADISAST